MSREQFLAANKFANVLTGIVPLLRIRPEWEIRFRTDLEKFPPLQVKFALHHRGHVLTQEHAIPQRRHFGLLEINRIAKRILSSTDAKFTAAVANYDQENPAPDLTPDDL